MLRIVTFAILIVTANANCPAITLDKGTITYDKAAVNGLYPEGTFAHGLCQQGFSLFGQSGTNCGKDGKWDGELGKCDVSPPVQAFTECSPTYVQNGVVTYDRNSDQVRFRRLGLLLDKKVFTVQYIVYFKAIR
ncbi:unnamed protein product [Heligmosomoides polygyrus]|uniref:Sushi domain-containing protein n=1 Tax=Heligmosomoides polygyrus TaxID=6339 RepID=A0A183F8Q1_HELPZ|nr:unnamed protein product [Heligmosomoides polygyrus]